MQASVGVESYHVSGALQLGLSVLEDEGGGGDTRSNQEKIFVDRNSENLNTHEAAEGVNYG